MEKLQIFSYVLILALLAALAWRDVKEYILPNKLNAALALVFCAFHILSDWRFLTPVDALTGAFAGGGMLLAIKIVADRYYQQDSLGLGDVKLMAAAGLGLGFPNIMLAMSLGAFIGVLHGVALSFWQERQTGVAAPIGKINVPAGLGLCIGTAIVFIIQFTLGAS